MVETDAWIGSEQTAVLGRLGAPTERYTGDVSPDLELRPIPNRPGEPPQTLYYRTRLGHLYLWFKPERGRWVCYHSLWYRDGIVF